MIRFLVFTALMILTCAPAHAENLSVTKAYAFATVPVQKNGAVFLNAQNKGPENISITGAKTERAEKAELHTMSMDDNVMQMRQIEKFEIKRGEVLNLTPMGDHIMLMGLKNPLKVGENFPLILSTENGDITVDVQIVSPGSTP